MIPASTPLPTGHTAVMASRREAPTLFLNERVALHAGDCLDVLRALPDASLDTCVCDPPYALVSIAKRFGKEGAAPNKIPEGKSGAYARASAGFMGKTWDTGERAFAVEFWAEVYRVLKPGGHVAAFGGTRTYHRLTCAIEDAGFEVRDRLSYFMAADTHVVRFLDSLNEEQRAAFFRCLEESQFGGELAWVFGSGFPKSHDVAKAITRRADPAMVREIKIWLAEQFLLSGKSKSQINREAGFTASDYLKTEPGNDAGGRATWHLLLPYGEKWDRLKAVVGFDARYDVEIAQYGIVASQRLQPKANKDVYGSFSGVVTDFDLTEAAAAWEGWGSALKPALEPICLARKPLDGTIAENVLAHGTGALNIAGCRVATPDDLRAGAGVLWSHQRKGEASAERRYTTEGSTNFAATPGPRGGSPDGRWPANVLHDGSPEVVAAFPEAPGQQRSVGPEHGAKSSVNVYGDYGARDQFVPRGDGGSAARFFYQVRPDHRCQLCGALTAAASSTTGSTPTASSAPGSAAVSPPLGSAGRSHPNISCASVAEPASLGCPQPSGDFAPLHAGMPALEKIVQNVSDAANLCASCATDIAHVLVEVRQTGKLGSLPSSLSIGASRRTILSHSLASYVEGRENTDTILTTTNLSELFGCVFHAIAESTSSASEEVRANTGRGSERLWYSAKADSDDRIGSKHPTVKPVDLMRWLVRLVTPPGGTVLDPFAGTGTTGEAAYREGFSAVLVEREAEYRADIARRMELVLAGPDGRKHAIAKAKAKPDDMAGTLFAPRLTAAE